MSIHLTAMNNLSKGLNGLREKIQTDYARTLAENPALRDDISNAFDAIAAYGQLAAALAGGELQSSDDVQPAQSTVADVQTDGGKKAAAK